MRQLNEFKNYELNYIKGFLEEKVTVNIEIEQISRLDRGLSCKIKLKNLKNEQIFNISVENHELERSVQVDRVAGYFLGKIKKIVNKEFFVDNEY